MCEVKRFLAVWMAMMMITPIGGFAANHRSAPITALDHPAGITDWYAFVSYDDPTKVTFIMDVDPLLEPSNGPNYFPFDPNVVYTMKIDNTYNGVEDITFQFQFTTVVEIGGTFLYNVGPIASLDSPNWNRRQFYSVTRIDWQSPTQNRHRGRRGHHDGVRHHHASAEIV